MMKENDEYKRLQWQCRRGMLELDVFLQKFLANAYTGLPLPDQSLFSTLLQETDQDLFVWLTGRDDPKDPELARMVEMIRANAKANH